MAKDLIRLTLSSATPVVAPTYTSRTTGRPVTLSLPLTRMRRASTPVPVGMTRSPWSVPTRSGVWPGRGAEGTTAAPGCRLLRTSSTAREIASEAGIEVTVVSTSRSVKYVPDVPVTVRLPAVFSVRTTYCAPNTGRPLYFWSRRTVSRSPSVSTLAVVSVPAGSLIR